MSEFLSPLAGKHIAVVGLGRSGLAAARVALQHGARVVGTDTRPRAAFGSALSELEAQGLELVLGDHAGVDWSAISMCVVSPGVPPLPLLSTLEAAGVEVMSELEFGLRLTSGVVVAVGGTNGKSTTTTLLGAILGHTGLPVFVGGNLGAPVCEAVGRPWEVLVLEVSSFQLERTPSIKPKVSLLLNVSEDHLDRYSSFDEYADAKGNAFINQTSEDVAVVPFDDSVCRRQAARGAARIVTFGGQGDYTVNGQCAIERATGARLPLSELELHGVHNQLNVLAAFAAARALNTSLDQILAGARAFTPLPHRMQLVGVRAGVRYYDDSKATNVGAAVTAIRGLSEERCVVVVGGRDKHGSYAPLVDALRAKARAVIVIGEAAELIVSAVGNAVPLRRASSMDDAVRIAAELAAPNDAVLLSPACSSFDMFTSYAHRGDAFSRAVAALDEATT